MAVAELEEIGLTLFIGGLMAFMAFIVYDLARQSKAGRFGSFVLFGALGLGVLAFVAKTIVQLVLAV